MDDKEKLAMRKKLFLIQVLAKALEAEGDFKKRINEVQEEKLKDDPFAPIPIKEIPESKPGSIKFNSKGLERFSALRNKLETINAEEPSTQGEEVNAETQLGE